MSGLYGVRKRRPFCVGDRGAAAEGLGSCFESWVSESDGGGAAGSVLKGPCVCICAVVRTRRTEVGKGGAVRVLWPPCCGRWAAPLLGERGRGFPAPRGLRRDEGPGAAGKIKI